MSHTVYRIDVHHVRGFCAWASVVRLFDGATVFSSREYPYGQGHAATAAAWEWLETQAVPEHWVAA